MDIVHHAFIGGAGFVALAANEQELAGMAFLAGSVFPDLDVAFMAAGKRFFLKRHQGPTHSLPLAPFYAAILSLPIALQIGWDWSLYLGLCAGLAVHVLLDLFNTFGIQLFWPITSRRYCLDAVFFIDSVTWALTLGYFALVMTGVVPAGAGAIGYAALFMAYAFAKLVLQRRVKHRLAADYAIPSAWNPFAFFLFMRRDGRFETAYYNALTGRTSDARAIPESPMEAVELAQQSEVFRDMKAILRGLSITRMDKGSDGITVVAQDLAVRNFGGRFGRTELRFDSDGRLRHEMADI